MGFFVLYLEEKIGSEAVLLREAIEKLNGAEKANATISLA